MGMVRSSVLEYRAPLTLTAYKNGIVIAMIRITANVTTGSRYASSASVTMNVMAGRTAMIDKRATLPQKRGADCISFPASLSQGARDSVLLVIARKEAARNMHCSS